MSVLSNYSFSKRSEMTAIEVDQETATVLSSMARALGIPVGQLVRRLVGLSSPTTVSATSMPNTSRRESAHAASLTPGHVKVFALYRNQRISGRFEPSTGLTWIDDGRLQGKRYSSPSAAANAVVEDLNPDRRFPNTNGRMFWRVEDSEKPLGEHFDAL